MTDNSSKSLIEKLQGKLQTQMRDGQIYEYPCDYNAGIKDAIAIICQHTAAPDVVLKKKLESMFCPKCKESPCVCQSEISVNEEELGDIAEQLIGLVRDHLASGRTPLRTEFCRYLRPYLRTTEPVSNVPEAIMKNDLWYECAEGGCLKMKQSQCTCSDMMTDRGCVKCWNQQPDELGRVNLPLAITNAALNRKSLLEMLEVHVVDYPTPDNIDMLRFYLAALKESERLRDTKRESVDLTEAEFVDFFFKETMASPSWDWRESLRTSYRALLKEYRITRIEDQEGK